MDNYDIGERERRNGVIGDDILRSEGGSRLMNDGGYRRTGHAADVESLECCWRNDEDALEHQKQAAGWHHVIAAIKSSPTTDAASAAQRRHMM